MKRIATLALLTTLSLSCSSQYQVLDKRDKITLDERVNRTKGVAKSHILIDKSDSKLYHFNGEFTTVYPVSLGSNSGKKRIRGDKKTPEGTYFICEKHHSKKFQRFMGLSYPNKQDAEDGLKEGIISKSQYNSIVGRLAKKQCPLWDTKLGGAVGLHGEKKINIFGYEVGVGPVVDWSLGCIATTTSNIKNLYNAVKPGTSVTIRP